MRVVQVHLGKRSYRILIGTGALDRLPSELQRLGFNRRCAVVTDANVAPRLGPRVVRGLERAGFEPCLVTVPAGERAKSLRQAAMCYDRLAAHRLERGSFVVALGGGVIGDLAGFVAATYLRGIALVQVPTTLLAQVDSSVGGKVGINLRAGKNLVGAFHQPRLVVCDLGALRSLPQREFRAGLAEVIKYGVISDARLFRRLERDLERLLRRESGPLESVVARCCEIKAAVVAEDETETGRRAILNFGHTVGHAIEARFGYGKFLHGEAIAVGQVAAARLSQALAGLEAQAAARIEGLLAAAGLPTRLRFSASQRARLIDAMRLDKKVRDGQVRFVLARRIGQVVWNQAVGGPRLETVLSCPFGADGGPCP